MWVSLTSSRVCSFTHLFTHLSIPQIFIDPLARCSRVHGGTYTHTYGYLRLNREGSTYSRCPPSGFNSSGDSESGACASFTCVHVHRYVLSALGEAAQPHGVCAYLCGCVCVCGRSRSPGSCPQGVREVVVTDSAAYVD